MGQTVNGKAQGLIRQIEEYDLRRIATRKGSKAGESIWHTGLKMVLFFHAALLNAKSVAGALQLMPQGLSVPFRSLAVLRVLAPVLSLRVRALVPPLCLRPAVFPLPFPSFSQSSSLVCRTLKVFKVPSLGLWLI